jgi:hypothetical protein
LAVNGAFDARRNRSQLSPAAQASRWASVIESCKASLPALRMLLRLSDAWQWPDEQQQVLEAITRDFAGESWAWRRLISQALVRGETEELWQVYQRWSRAAPGDTTVQIEAAIMGHLLQKSGAPSLLGRRAPGRNVNRSRPARSWRMPWRYGARQRTGRGPGACWARCRRRFLPSRAMPSLMA